MSKTFLAKINEFEKMDFEKILEGKNIELWNHLRLYSEDFKYRNFDYQICINCYPISGLAIDIDCDVEIFALLEDIYKNAFFYYSNEMNKENFFIAKKKAERYIDIMLDETISFLNETIIEAVNNRNELQKIIDKIGENNE